MPQIGDITHGRELGKVSQTSKNAKHIFVTCPECGKTKWTRLRPTTATGYSRCQSCCGKAQVNRNPLMHGRGDKSPHWKGGRRFRGDRYVTICLPEDNPYYPMTTHQRRGSGTVMEHRLIMAQHLGRCLTKQEHVHHKNGDRMDNRLENLELISPSNHRLYDVMCSHCSLRKEVRMLKATIKELKNSMPHLIS